MSRKRFAVVSVLACLIGVGLLARASQSETSGEASFVLHPVGTVEVQEGGTYLKIDPQYAAALRGLDQWSHVWVLYWFDKNDTPQKRSILQVHPRGNPKNPLMGVFATRSPVRPNLIALTLCKILSVEGNRVRIDKIDAFGGSPIVDLKPYIPTDRSEQDLRVPAWARR